MASVLLLLPDVAESMDEFRKQLYTPFVVALASGNLDMKTMLFHTSHEFYLLRCLYQALELAGECVDDDDDKIFNLLAAGECVDDDDDMISFSDLRKSILTDFNQSDSIRVRILNFANCNCTDFLVATASGTIEGVVYPVELVTPFDKTKFAAYTLGAIMPYMRVYGFICKEIQSLLDTSGTSHQYKEWIAKYSSKHFQAFTLQTERLLDRLCVSLTARELDIIQKLYHQAMKNLTDFISAQPMVQKTVVPPLKENNPSKQRLMVFFNFDLTCTVVDSSAILARLAARMPTANQRNTWQLISREYTEKYEQCMDEILLTEKLDVFAVDCRIMIEAFKQLSEVKKRANTRVIESGVLWGINLEDIKRAGEHLILQDGCMSFFQSITKNENVSASIHVLSYCWCNDLIKSAFSSGGLHTMDIHANEFTYEESISTGEFSRRVESPINKAVLFGNIRENRDNDRKSLTIYIGHSVGDLLCLLMSDIGIVIGSSESLRRVGSHFGVSFVPLFRGLVQKQKELGEGTSCSWRALTGILYTVSSWAEIHAFVVGCN